MCIFKAPKIPQAPTKSSGEIQREAERDRIGMGGSPTFADLVIAGFGGGGGSSVNVGSGVRFGK